MASLLAALCGISSAAEWHKGENLITPFVPSTDEWDAYERNEKSSKSLLWKLKSNEDDRYAVTLFQDYDKSLAEFRAIQDAPGQEHCAKFSSAVIDETPINGYGRLMWRTSCLRDDGSVASILHLAIEGRDSFYHMLKSWRFEVSSTEIEGWIGKFRANTVCDTRRKAHPCPEGYKRVQ